MMHYNKKEVTRRDFLRGAGASVAGLTVVGSAGLLMKNTVFAKQAAPARPAAAEARAQPKVFSAHYRSRSVLPIP